MRSFRRESCVLRLAKRRRPYTAQLTENVVTNLQYQIDSLKTYVNNNKLDKVTDKASQAEVLAGTVNNKWVSPADLKKNMTVNGTVSTPDGSGAYKLFSVSLTGYRFRKTINTNVGSRQYTAPGLYGGKYIGIFNGSNRMDIHSCSDFSVVSTCSVTFTDTTTSGATYYVYGGYDFIIIGKAVGSVAKCFTIIEVGTNGSSRIGQHAQLQDTTSYRFIPLQYWTGYHDVGHVGSYCPGGFSCPFAALPLGIGGTSGAITYVLYGINRSSGGVITASMTGGSSSVGVNWFVYLKDGVAMTTTTGSGASITLSGSSSLSTSDKTPLHVSKKNPNILATWYESYSQWYMTGWDILTNKSTSSSLGVTTSTGLTLSPYTGRCQIVIPGSEYSYSYQTAQLDRDNKVTVTSFNSVISSSTPIALEAVMKSSTYDFGFSNLPCFGFSEENDYPLVFHAPSGTTTLGIYKRSLPGAGLGIFEPE